MSLYLPKHMPGLADAATETGKSKLAEMMNRARGVSPYLMGIDLIDMGHRGCDCMLTGLGPMDEAKAAIAERLTARLPHHVDFPYGTPGWNAESALGKTWGEKRAEIADWCFENVRGAYNEFRTCQRDDLGVATIRVWRWAFADKTEAAAFRIRWG